MKIRIATRKSPLALAQTRWVAEALRAHRPDLEVEEVPISTKGDQILDKPLAQIGGKGLFVTEIENALLDGRADIAVHSMKDVPAELARGLGIAAIPEREDPRDTLVTRGGIGLYELEAGAHIGTSSLRRQAQLRGARNDVRCSTLRGSVGTRLGKLESGQFDAIVLAQAGILRLGLDIEGQPLDVATCVPAVGQGALGLEVRTEDRDVLALVAPLEHTPTRIAVEAERAFLAKMEGSCQLPIAGYARLQGDGGHLRLDAMVGSPDGQQLMNTGLSRVLLDQAPEARLRAAYELGVEAAEELLQKGAADLVDAARELAQQLHWKH